MSKIIKKGTSILIVVMLLISVFSVNTSAAQAEEDAGVMPCWTTISTISTDFTISGINSSIFIRLTSQVSTTLQITVNLQKLKSGVYETIDTWVQAGMGTRLVLDETRLINVFSDYRIKVTCKAGSETNVTYDYP